MKFLFKKKIILKNIFQKQVPNRPLWPVWLLFLKMVFKDTKNIILVFFENCYFSLNLMFFFFVFFVFFRTKEN